MAIGNIYLKRTHIMFYRRKILLALLESFGGRLKNTDFQKLTFLFCKETGETFYDFFPYKYGGFSFVIYQDKRILSKQGFLKDSEDFQIGKNNGLLYSLKKEDREQIIDFTRKMNKLKTPDLIRKAYMEYPEYTEKSEILNKYFSSEEQLLLKQSSIFKLTPEKAIFTIGYEGKSIDAYLNELIANDIRFLIDVRKNPKSMKFDFNKNKMRSYLQKIDVKYMHIPELGIDSELRRDLSDSESYGILFEKYEKELLPLASKELSLIKNTLDEYKRVALTCFEKHYSNCHRHKIAEKLNELYKKQFETIHI